MRRLRFAAFAAAPLVALAVALVATAGPASAHTLDSSSVRLVQTDDGLTGTISLAVASLDRAFDAAHRSDAMTDAAYEAQVAAYVDEHLTVQGADGLPWAETYSDVVLQTTEGIETVTLSVAVDAAGADPSDVAVTYDAVIEAVPDHEAVLILESASGSVSTPGVFAADRPTITIGDGATTVGIADMVRMGLHHVLDGADHLMFLVALLLPAPLVVSTRRWTRAPSGHSTVRRVLHVVTAFTVGHSLTLVATALGWIEVPSRPVEVLIAVSVAVSAVHAVRPLVRGGEAVIAATFGLVHGLAFAGILRDLGLQGRTSVLALLGFNVGIELAQLVVVAAVVPLLIQAARRPWFDRARVGGAAVVLVVSGAWILDRLGWASDPFAAAEAWTVDHLWWGLALSVALAVGAAVADRASSGRLAGTLVNGGGPN